MRNTGHRCLCLIIPSILTPVYLFIFLHYLTIPIPIAGYTYTPTENFAINCGSAGNWQESDRNWTGDVDSKFSPSEKGKLSTTSPAAQQPLQSIPYSTARLSRNDFFSVKTGGGYTLLSNFSAALAADDLGTSTIVREFCINFNEEGEKLHMTFTPTAAADAYAFINGIEIVSMPDYLYYTSPQDGEFKFIGQQSSFSVETDHALENVYRLNVGGQFISPKDDTGMFRTWEKDDDYCVKLAFVPANNSINLKFTQIPNYTAPLHVYRTARTMGNNKTENMGYNLTWLLPVDSGFSYLLRLHFCEFQPEIQEQQDREFTIFIANQTAENHADVIKWSGGNGVPIYKDYGVMMITPSQGSNKKQNLSIQLHPNPDYETVYNDAILNGIELFKLSNSENSLAGPNPDPLEAPAPSPPAQSTSPKGNKTKLIAISGSVVAGLIALSVIALFIVWRGRRVRDSEPSDGGSWWGQFSYTSVKSTKTSRSSLPSDLCRHFTLQEIKVATNNFDNVFIIGVGGFGTCTKGISTAEQHRWQSNG
ncbi:Receptor-like protein kinase FERONIA [Vitis vinifera]|uniref:Receptor-like protein kinase FERONIA n=1 Tax=Vitis vinifera TaxID=29760 RepID=A0A438HE43_VITVI|nr:Receptor-like protein kinase FERONIA [Vitis vinifera]